MPQLMPLLWMISVFMVCTLIFMLIDMYYFSSIFLLKMVFSKSMNEINYLW